MRPAFSVVFLTTLTGAGQGLFLALYAAEFLAGPDLTRPFAPSFVALGAAIACVLAALGLVASFFHLGRPLRAWRSAAKWRTSWLSREVIALPLFIAACAAWGAAHLRAPTLVPAIGAAALAACLALFVCTAMIYACIRFLQEWASAFTSPISSSSAAPRAAPSPRRLAALRAPEHAAGFAAAALALTLAALACRAASLVRNARLRPKSTLQSAIGVRAAHIEQKSQGFMGGSFNTREFFHGASPAKLVAVKWGFIAFGFVVPVVLLAAGLALASGALLVAAPLVQYAGIVAERWFFLAQANHPQNLYYQAMA